MSLAGAYFIGLAFAFGWTPLRRAGAGRDPVHRRWPGKRHPGRLAAVRLWFRHDLALRGRSLLVARRKGQAENGFAQNVLDSIDRVSKCNFPTRASKFFI